MPKDAKSLLLRVEQALSEIESLEEKEQKQRQINPETQFVSLKILRLKFIIIKLKRMLGLYELSVPEKAEKIALEDIFLVFLQAMESHPSVLATVGVS